MELGETQGNSQRQISEETGVSLGTVHAILNRAHGWDVIAEGEAFKRHRIEQNKALEQANRTLAKKSLEMAEQKMDKASYSQLVFGAAIMTDKARLLAGESTSNVAHLHEHTIPTLEKVGELLARSMEHRLETKTVKTSQD